MQKVSEIPQPGDSGVNVRVLQESLNRAGADPKLEVDGDFGLKTQAAVSVFQKKIGLAGSGLPGKDTMVGLGILVEPETENPPHGGPAISDPGASGGAARRAIASKIVGIVNSDVQAKLRETRGKNRSPRIDEFNKRAKAPMGSPYCASGLWCAIDDACKQLGLKNPVKPTASSQAFRKTSFVPEKYIRREGEMGRIGDFGVLQVPGNSAHGHLTVLGADQRSQPIFYTLEYNTDASGDRDGDGAYATSRSTKDGDKQNSGKLFICFVDVCQWILDANV